MNLAQTRALKVGDRFSSPVGTRIVDPKTGQLADRVYTVTELHDDFFRIKDQTGFENIIAIDRRNWFGRGGSQHFMKYAEKVPANA